MSWGGHVLDRVVREAASAGRLYSRLERNTRSGHAAIWEREVQPQGNVRVKGPGVGTCLPCFGKNRRYRQSAGDTGQVMWGLEDHGKDFVFLFPV